MSQPLYDTDFYTWTQTQAEALRAKQWQALDVENLAEEIESLGKRDRRSRDSQLVRLMQHLLKWHYQPLRRSPSWRRSIYQAQTALEDVLEDNRSLREIPPAHLAKLYERARRLAIQDTGLPLSTFPEACPWTIEQLLAPQILPEA
jgi:hypothetical protein